MPKSTSKRTNQPNFTKKNTKGGLEGNFPSRIPSTKAEWPPNLQSPLLSGWEALPLVDTLATHYSNCDNHRPQKTRSLRVLTHFHSGRWSQPQCQWLPVAFGALLRLPALRFRSLLGVYRGHSHMDQLWLRLKVPGHKHGRRKPEEDLWSGVEVKSQKAKDDKKIFLTHDLERFFSPDNEIQ